MTTDGKIFLAVGARLLPLPLPLFRLAMTVQARAVGASLAFMSEDHHRVRNFAVTELMRTGQPIPPEAFAEALDLDTATVTALLDKLERRLMFLVRNEAGCVTWAYPITVEPTPHRARFAGGEQAFSP